MSFLKKTVSILCSQSPLSLLFKSIIQVYYLSPSFEWPTLFKHVFIFIQVVIIPVVFVTASSLFLYFFNILFLKSAPVLFENRR